MLAWLEANGVRRSDVLKHHAAGRIRPHTLPPSRVRYYLAAEIQAEILDRLTEQR
jgi:hypothetical protein